MIDPTVMVAIVAAIPPTLAAIFSALLSLRNGQKIKALHVEVNGRLTQLLVSTALASRLQGEADEAVRAIESARRRPV